MQEDLDGREWKAGAQIRSNVDDALEVGGADGHIMPRPKPTKNKGNSAAQKKKIQTRDQSTSRYQYLKVLLFCDKFALQNSCNYDLNAGLRSTHSTLSYAIHPDVLFQFLCGQ